MKTLFSMGFSGSPFAARPSLGQETLSDKDKSSLYDQLVDTDGKLGIVEEWEKNHPSAAADLGSDARRFKELEATASSLREAAQAMERKTEAAGPVVVTLEELGQIETWMATVHEMYVIVANHKGSAPASAAPPPAAPPSTVNPIVIGIGAVGLLTLMIVAIK